MYIIVYVESILYITVYVDLKREFSSILKNKTPKIIPEEMTPEYW